MKAPAKLKNESPKVQAHANATAKTKSKTKPAPTNATEHELEIVTSARTPADKKASDTRSLAEPERKLFSEALRRGESAREGMEDLLKDYGSWLFVNLFNSDSTQVLENRREHPVWQVLVARAGGSTLRLNERMLTVSLLCAAYDKRLNDDNWRALDLGRKELLLRLESDELLREGARHALNSKLTIRATRDYVLNVLEENGIERDLRVSVPRVQTWLSGIQERLTAGGFQKKLALAARDIKRADRRKLQRQVDAIQRELGELSARIAALPNKG